jgi:cyclophilin family peptidyl-prolyl cis-trans isomerase
MRNRHTLLLTTLASLGLAATCTLAVYAQDAAKQAAPTQATPAQATPAQATPAQATSAQAAPAPAAAMVEFGVMHTTLGDIVFELDRAKAPISVENFVGYIKDGFFDGTVFHRVVPGFVIQGGGFEPNGRQKPTKAPIQNEWQNGLKNLRGTLSMARTGEPNSATSQFFISLNDNANLDQPISGGAGYAVFGRVIAGMDVVDQIALAQRGMRGRMRDWPVKDIVMTKVELITKDAADKLVRDAAEKAAKPAATAAPVSPAAAPVSPAAAPVPPAAAPVAPATPAAPATTTTPATPKG